jgi:hypothetical protein
MLSTALVLPRFGKSSDLSIAAPDFHIKAIEQLRGCVQRILIEWARISVAETMRSLSSIV